MQFTVEREKLLKLLQLISGVVEKHQTLPILSHTLLVVKGGQLFLLATDLEIELMGSLALKSMDSPGETTVPAAMFLQICRSLPEEAVLDIRLKDQSVIIKSGRSRFTLSSLAARDFPRMETSKGVGQFSILQNDLRFLIEKTHFAMAMQDVRYFLNGLLFDINQNGIRCVATDGHRMAMNALSAKVNLEPQQLIVPRKAIVELLRLLSSADDDIMMTVGESHLGWNTPDFTFMTKLIDGKFPDFERVIPRDPGKHIVVRRENFKHALGRVSILANEKLRGVSIKFHPGKMVISAQNMDQHAAEEELECDYTGEPMSIGFNVNYLTDFLNVASSQEIKLILTQAESSALIQEMPETKGVYVVMPMRI